jgi:hypothetical protein
MMRAISGWAAIACLAIFTTTASAADLRTIADKYYSTDPATALVPPPGIPPLPKWELKPPGAKPVMASVTAQPGLSGPNVYDLRKFGYTEEEYFLAGAANLYAVGGKGVVKADIPYVTRILIRRPTDPAKFSGNVIVEPSRDVNEWTTLWPSAARTILARGDVYVAFTMAKANLPVFFKSYDPARYAALDIPDEGLRWDIMAQTLGLMRSQDGPLARLGFLDAAARKGGLKVISTGTSLTGIMQSAFVDNGHHARARRADGGPVVDGYLQLVSGRPMNLPSDAPVVALVSEGDTAHLLSGQLETFRHADADGPTRFRWYEIAGVAHANWDDQSQFTPSFQLIGAGPAATPHCATPISDIAVKDDLVSAALVNLEDWLRAGKAPPPGTMLALKPDQTVRKDAYGNAQGGLRPYWVAVPAGHISPDSAEVPGATGIAPTGGLCGMLAHDDPLPKDALARLYKSHDDYVAKVDVYLKQQVAEGYLLPDGAARELAQAKAAAVP